MDILNKIFVNPKLDTTLAQQLSQQLTWLIASGQLKPGDRLPSVRQAADRLKIHMHTVRSAYQKLEADGLAATRQGVGTIVLPYDPQRMRQITGLQPSHTIGVIIPSLTNSFYHLFLQGVEAIADKNRTLLFMCVTHDDPSQAGRYYAQLAAKNVDGILLASQDDSLFTPQKDKQDGQAGQGLPLVVVDWPDSAGYSVSLDLEQAGYLATRHLVEHGHRRVGLITFSGEFANVNPVRRGYQRALHEAGIAGEPEWIAKVPGFDTTAGAEGAHTLLALEPRPTAIFAISDLLAIGAMCAIQQAGLQIPEQVAIVGFNDIPLAEMVTPSLTTVAAPAYQMGLEAMKMLQDLILGERPKRQKSLLPTALVIRQSCGCPGGLLPC